MSLRDSQATFSKSVKNAIRERYHHRCAICLQLLPEVSIQAAHLIDSAAGGASQLGDAVNLGVITEEYQRSSDVNGMAQCPTCHIGFFTPNLIALSPSLPVLDYIYNYLIDIPVADQKPLHEVFDLLRLAMVGDDVTLPDPTSILPYLGLFTIVILRPEDVVERFISTPHLPSLSTLRNNRFVPAPARTSPANQNAARIFDVLAITASTRQSPSLIPLSPADPKFQERRYWRLPLKIEAVLAALMSRIGPHMKGKEITLALAIRAILTLRNLDRRGVRVMVSRSRPSGSGGSRGGRGGGSGRGRGRGPGRGRPSGGGGRPGGGSRPSGGLPKGNLQSRERDEPPPKKGRTKAGGHHKRLDEKDVLKSRSLGAAELAFSDQSASPERNSHGIHPCDWEVASSFSTVVDDGSVRTRSPFDNSESMSIESDSEVGCNDPAIWRFGPAYRSDMIIVAARGISLV